MQPLTDTTPEAERVLIQAYRAMPFAEKWRQMGAIYQTARALHAAGVRSRNPTATDQEIREDWMAAALGDTLCQEVKEALRGRQR